MLKSFLIIQPMIHSLKYSQPPIYQASFFSPEVLPDIWAKDIFSNFKKILLGDSPGVGLLDRFML